MEDVALATAGNLGFLTEPMITGSQRQRLGNSLYGQYGANFTSADRVSFMLVALTPRHFRDLTELTGTAKAVAALAEALEADFNDEGQRYRHREALTGLFSVWFAEHTGDEIAAGLAGTSILWERYRTFTEASADPKVTANPLFSLLDQPRVGQHLAPGLPLIVDGAHSPAVPAPALGDHTEAVLTGRLGMSAADVATLTETGTVAGPSVDGRHERTAGDPRPARWGTRRLGRRRPWSGGQTAYGGQFWPSRWPPRPAPSTTPRRCPRACT